jgi:hypothetical protein
VGDSEDMERLKAEWAQAQRVGRISGVKRLFGAVLSDSVSAVIMVSSLVLGITLIYYAMTLYHDAVGSHMGRGLGGLVITVSLGVPLGLGWRFVLWWRHRTGRG